jgi:hypothetical protein
VSHLEGCSGFNAPVDTYRDNSGGEGCEFTPVINLAVKGVNVDGHYRPDKCDITIT